MNICIVSGKFPPVYSGMGQQASRLSREFRAQGHNVVVLSRWYPGLGQRETLDGIEIHRISYPLSSRNRPTLGGLLRLSTLLFRLRSRYEQVLFFSVEGDFPGCWPVLLLLRGLGKKTAARMTMLGSNDPATMRRRPLGFLRVLPYRLHHGTVSLSSGLAMSYESVFGRRGNLGVIANGVDTERFCPVSASRRAAIRRTLGLDGSLRYCAFVGRISHRKGIDIIIEAWRHIVRAHPDARLLLIGPTVDEHRQEGDAAFVTQIKSTIAEHKLDDTIIWTGHADSVETYLQASDVFLFASRREGLPSAVLEAMACGLPVVTVRIPNITDDLISSGTEGLVTSPQATEFAEAVIRVLSTPDDAEAMSQAARQKAIQRFSVRRMAEQYASVLAGL